MIKDKFTPGPWEVKDDFYVHSVASNDKEYFICDSVGFGQSFSKARANAKLIAAAPNMFRLLKDIRDWVEGEGEPFQYSEEINQIIAKAEEAL